MSTKIDKSLILKEIKSYLKIKTDSEFADYLGIASTTLSSWKVRNSFDYDLIYAKCEWINPKFLLTGEGDITLKDNDYNYIMEESNAKKDKDGIPLIPIDAVAGVGSGEFMIQESDIEQRYFIPEFRKADYLIRVKGSSMYPKYSAGDILACVKMDKSKFIQWNKTYVVDTTQGIMVKRILEGENCWILRSDNKDYQDIKISPDEEINGISLVIGVVRFE